MINKQKINFQLRPKLELFHPNGKGTGCAIRMDLIPATGQMEGSIMLEMANQATAGNMRGPNPVYPRFNWEKKLVVRLGFNDLCKVLQVFRGECESLEDGRGLYHRTAKASTKIVLRHMMDPIAGYSLELYRTTASGENESAHFIFSSAEALGVCETIADVMGIVAFGIPSERQDFKRTCAESENANMV